MSLLFSLPAVILSGLKQKKLAYIALFSTRRTHRLTFCKSVPFLHVGIFLLEIQSAFRQRLQERGLDTIALSWHSAC